MALLIEKISDTKIWIHDGPTSIMEIDTTEGVRINSTFKIGTDLISPSASELAAIDGLTKTASQLNALVGGAAGGYRIARSAAPVALDGSNPTTVATGLTTVVAAFAQLVGSDAPGDSTMLLTCVINTTNIDVYAWKHTDGTDPTLVASTGTETFNWFCIGT